MALKDMWKKITGKSDSIDIVPQQETAVAPLASEAFPVVKLSEEQLSAYKSIPMTGLAALGTAFMQLPEGARTAVQSVTKTSALKETLFIGINPKGVPGFLRQNEYGTVGNIMQVNPQGKQVIAGRMRFKPIDNLPVTETTTTTLPIDPMLMVVAVALMNIEKGRSSVCRPSAYGRIFLRYAGVNVVNKTATRKFVYITEKLLSIPVRATRRIYFRSVLWQGQVGLIFKWLFLWKW